MLATLRGIRPSQEQFSTEKHTLLIFNDSKVDVRTFSNFREAIAEYFELERSSDSETNVVLVAADDPESVRFGFKNYFSDAREFVRLMEEVLEWATSPTSITL